MFSEEIRSRAVYSYLQWRPRISGLDRAIERSGIICEMWFEIADEHHLGLILPNFVKRFDIAKNVGQTRSEKTFTYSFIYSPHSISLIGWLIDSFVRPFNIEECCIQQCLCIQHCRTVRSGLNHLLRSWLSLISFRRLLRISSALQIRDSYDSFIYFTLYSPNETLRFIFCSLHL